MTGAGEATHVGAGPGDDHIGNARGDPGDGDERSQEATKRFDHYLDAAGQLADGPAVAVDRSTGVGPKPWCSPNGP